MHPHIRTHIYALMHTYIDTHPHEHIILIFYSVKISSFQATGKRRLLKELSAWPVINITAGVLLSCFANQFL